MPKLRFPGFEGEWERTAFNSLFSILKNNTLSRAELTDSGTIKNIHYGDILVKFDDFIKVENPMIPYVKDTVTLKYEMDYLQSGDIVIADTAEDDTVGKATEIINPTNIPVVSGLHTIPCRPNKIFASSYLGYYINSSAYHKQLYPFMQGIKVTSISKGNIRKTTISYPSNNEQHKIANFLILVSVRIEKQHQLIETLKKYKRGVMRDIFRDKDILYSKETKWNSVRLGDECTFFSGGTPKSNDSSYYGGAIPFIRSGEIHGEKTELFLTDAGLKNSSAKMVSKGDLIVALYGATSGEVDISKIDGAINQAILCIRPAVINKIFLKYLLEDSKENILNIYLQGGQGNLSAEIIKNLVFDIPDVRSQASVAYFLSIIDRRINSLLVCLEKLTALRSGMMQQLFI